MSVPASPQENQSRTSAAVATSEAPKRKRGRPRKHPLPGIVSAPVSEAEIPVNGKRRRGRPPKQSRVPEPVLPKYDDIHTPEIQEKLRFLIRLAKEQDYLTFDDFNEALPNGFVTPELLDEIIIRLRSLEIEIIEPTEVDRVKAKRPTVVEDEPIAEEREEGQLDMLDDPVRMYLKQMGAVPLLTRDQ